MLVHKYNDVDRRKVKFAENNNNQLNSGCEIWNVDNGDCSGSVSWIRGCLLFYRPMSAGPCPLAYALMMSLPSALSPPCSENVSIFSPSS